MGERQEPLPWMREAAEKTANWLYSLGREWSVHERPQFERHLAALIADAAPKPGDVQAIPDAQSLPLYEREALSEAAMAAGRQFNADPGNFLRIAQAAIYTWQAAHTARPGLTEAIATMAELEGANDAACALRTDDVYLSLLGIPGMGDALTRLDAARASARAILDRLTSAPEKKP